jgi:hypothetical protein
LVASKAALSHLGKGARIIRQQLFAESEPTSILGVYADSKSALAAVNQALAGDCRAPPHSKCESRPKLT